MISDSEFLIVVFTWIIGIPIGKKPKSKIWLAMGVAVVGVYLLCVNGSLNFNTGDIYTFIGSIMFAIQIIAIDKSVEDEDPIALSIIQQAVCSVFDLIFIFFIDKPTSVNIIGNILPILYVAIGSGIIAQTLQIVYQKDLDASLSSLIMSLESVFGALIGWLALNQVLSIREIIGCVLIFTAVLIAE